MIDLQFPDGAERSYPDATTGREVAEGLSRSLAKKAALVRLDGVLLDLDRPLAHGGRIEILTRDHPDVLETLRHDAAHVMAEAVQELFPGTQVTIGPAIEDGFYYDFARAEPFSLDDLPKIEQRMREIVDRDEPIRREVLDRDAAIARFQGLGEAYKAEIIADLPPGEEISLYHQGGWADLCRGPHLPSTRFVGKAFKLTKLAGAYWRGDHRNAQLQRVYGTAWASEADLDAHLKRIEEAEKRDHRRIGRAMDLFHIQEEGKGMVFWHRNGWTLYRALESYMRRRLEAAGYQEVKTPQVLDRTLWERSGHWEKFGQAMFVCETEEGETLAVKPMNCPGHIQIFNVGQKSYRDLPLRMAEFGSCHRYEPSGGLHGIMRVRGFTQDDAHIFCREDQIAGETEAFIGLLQSIYDDVGLTLDDVKFSTRPEVRAGSDEVWNRAEAALRQATEAAGVSLTLNPGEGAFYGPKLEFSLRDAIGRVWQCGTLQLDFVLPERLDAEYVAEDGSKQRPVMLHRAVLGSFERFIGILTEHYAGAFPLWLAPVQVVVATITSDADDYARRAVERLRAAGLRVEADLRNEKINYKIREHSLAKVPVIAVVGRKEAELGQLALRRLGSDRQAVLGLDEAAEGLAREALAPDLAVARDARPTRTLEPGMNTYVRPLNGGFLELAQVVQAHGRGGVTVVMVVYRTGPALKESVARVLAEPLVDEFVIIDNGSTPEEEAVLDSAALRDPRVRLERGHGNVGFARGANMGAAAASSGNLVFLNPDAFLQPGCIAGLNAALRRAPSPCIVGARVLNPNGTEQRGARRGEVTPVTTLLSLTRLSHHVRALSGFEIHHEEDPTPQAVVPVPTISGACFAMTRCDFASMGGFDVGYFLHVEDVDLCWRVRKSGGQVLFQPAATVVHLGSTSRTSPIKVEFWKGLGLARYFRKRADNPRRAVLAHLLAPLIVIVSVSRPLLRPRRPH